MALATAVIFGLGVVVGKGTLTVRLGSSNPLFVNRGSGLDYSSVDAIYNLLRQNYDGEITKEQALEGIKEGLAAATGDEYTEYLTREESKQFSEQLNGSFEGIGAELGKEDDTIIIVAPLSGFPAERAGLRPRDAVLSIDGKNARGISISQAVKLIRGPKGTAVKLMISRSGAEPFELTVTRAAINVPSVTHSVEGGTGYLKISHFGTDTVALAYQAVADFQRQKVGGIVLDLRSNPGGYLEGAVDISSLWLTKDQKVVEEKNGSKTRKTHYANGRQAPLAKLPTVVLINEGSASASEIVAGALKDNKVATLVGGTTFGKGSVQQVEPLLDGSSLKVTIARWYTPAGRNIDKEGIEPDIEITPSEADLVAQKDVQKDKALELLRQKIQ